MISHALAAAGGLLVGFLITYAILIRRQAASSKQSSKSPASSGSRNRRT